MKFGNRRAFWFAISLCLSIGITLTPSLAWAVDPVAQTLTFKHCNSVPADYPGLAALFKVKIVNVDATHVKIVIENDKATTPTTNGIPPTITAIYFKGIYSELFTTAAPIFTPEPNSDYVDMLWNDGSPGGPDLPGGENCHFDAEAHVASDPPPTKSGISRGEGLGLTFKLASGKSVNDVIAACKRDDTNAEAFRVGIHVQEIASPYKLSGAANSTSLVTLQCDPKGTSITLASSSVEKADAGVQVNWTTAVEIDNAGFNLYRASTAEGPYVKVNEQLIGANGNGGGASYSVVDSNGHVTDFYQLEDVDFNGASVLHDLYRSDAAADSIKHLFMPVLSAE